MGKRKIRKDYRKNMMGFQYKLILGIFITGLVLGLLLLIMTFDIGSRMTWVYIAWVVFFGVTIYCWIDEDRYAKYEYYLTPVLFGLLFLLFAFFTVGGLYYGIVSYAREGLSLASLLAVIFGSACCGLFAYFSYVFYLRPYLVKDKDDE